MCFFVSKKEFPCGNSRKVISTITGIDAEFLGVPSLAYKIGDYAVDKDGTVTGPASKELVEALEAKGFTSKNREGDNNHE